MRIGMIKLVNYIGIYNGLKLHEITIDFSKCLYRKTLIMGDNGSGKTTLEKALSPKPDSNDQFIPGLPASKDISIIDGDIIYYIHIDHPVNGKGERGVTKAYISKGMGNTTEELNHNGNISSFYDILYNELSLDQNYIALSQLSSEDRGLVDKRPADRKKFVNSIINLLQVYNDIFKKLCKKHSLLKSHIQNITTKLRNLGDEVMLSQNLTALETRINSYTMNKDNLISMIASKKSKIEVLDPDLSIQNTYNEIISEFDDLKIELEKLQTSISKSSIKIDNEEELKSYYDKITKASVILESEINQYDSIIKSLLIDQQSQSKKIDMKNAKITSMKITNNSNISMEIESVKKTINEYEEIFNNIGLTNIDNISKDEFILGLETLKTIRESCSTFKSYFDESVKVSVINKIRNNIQLPNINELNTILNDLEYRYDNIKSKLEKFYLLRDVSAKLELRDPKCNSNTCKFIVDALDAESQKPNENIDILEPELKQLEEDITSYKNLISTTQDEYECYNQINTLLRSIGMNSNILNKLPIDININKDTILTAIERSYNFNEIDKIYEYIQYANMIDEYKSFKIKYNDLQLSYNKFRDKEDLINEILSDIDILNEELNCTLQKIENNKDKLFKAKKLRDKYKTEIQECEYLLRLLSQRKDLLSKRSDLISRFNTIKDNMANIMKYSKDISDLEIQLCDINEQLKPMIKERDDIIHNLKLAKDYKVELNELNKNYNKIATIRRYSSPNSGIQTIFMEMYMNNTLSIANQMLSLMFGGEYVIGQFVINETEFRIPCIGEGIINDDISSMSTAQKCMISMILSFAMLQQSETRYNIIKLDEIDGGLDTINRLNFLNTLDRLMELLNTEQVFLISHNNEIDYASCDIIQLKLSDPENRKVAGNIIYSYQ